MQPLKEIAERDASGIIAELYQDIRVRLGLPFVNLIYRHLATVPGMLELIWTEVAESMDTPDFSRTIANEVKAAKADWVQPLPVVYFEEIGFSQVERRLALNTLQSYEKGNSKNAVIMSYLLLNAVSTDHVADAKVTIRNWKPLTADDVVQEILPMQDLSKLSSRKMAMLDDLARITVGEQRRADLFPSIFRHFAHNGSLLTAIRASLGTAESLSMLREWEDLLRTSAESDARRMGGTQIALTPETVTVLKTFRIMMFRMIGVGKVLARLFGE